MPRADDKGFAINDIVDKDELTIGVGDRELAVEGHPHLEATVIRHPVGHHPNEPVAKADAVVDDLDLVDLAHVAVMCEVDFFGRLGVDFLDVHLVFEVRPEGGDERSVLGVDRTVTALSIGAVIRTSNR